MKRLSLTILMLLFAGPAFAAPQCIAPPTCAANQALKWNGTAFFCTSAAEAPVGASGPNQLLQWDGSRFVQTNLYPVLNNSFSGGGCGMNQVMTWNGSAFICTTPPTVTTPGAACAPGQSVTWNGSAFVCAASAVSTAPAAACASNQSVTWNGTAFVCTTAPVPSGTLCGLATATQPGNGAAGTVPNVPTGPITGRSNITPCAGANIIGPGGLSCPTGYTLRAHPVSLDGFTSGDTPGTTVDPHTKHILLTCAKN